MCAPDLSQRVNSVKEENHKLKAENEVGLLSCLFRWCFSLSAFFPFTLIHMLPPHPPQLLDQYIDNLMATSTFFSKTSTAPPPRSSSKEQQSS